jgi:hypothetical protein
MLFQGRELKVGDVLESKCRGKITVRNIKNNHDFAATDSVGDVWNYVSTGQFYGRPGIDATWPPSVCQEDIGVNHVEYIQTTSKSLAEQQKAEREAEYRRIWIECAMRLFALGSSHYDAEGCFIDADGFLAELRRRDSQTPP